MRLERKADMSEFSRTITLCDNCRPGEQGEGLPFFPFVRIVVKNEKGKPTFEYPVLRMPGVWWGAFDAACANAGWQEREYGQLCPECIAAEAEQEKFDGAEGTVSGAVYDRDLPGGEDESD
jgi:hypothetical protein